MPRSWLGRSCVRRVDPKATACNSIQAELLSAFMGSPDSSVSASTTRIPDLPPCGSEVSRGGLVSAEEWCPFDPANDRVPRALFSHLE